jgi:hypothetical protein
MKRGSTSRRRIDPIAQLMQEHDSALLHLSSLRKATQQIVEGGYTSQRFAVVLEALRFIDEEVSVHNKSEEDALFPVLERYVEGPTRLMKREHNEMRKKFVQLKRAVDRVAKNPLSQKAASDLQAVARGIIQMFVNHIHKENHILFPLVQKFLTKDALREVARRML